MSTQNVVDMYKNDRVTRRYSEGFKLKILAELSTGKYSKRQLSNIYGLRSSTINGWIKKYDRKDLMNTRIMVENQDEISRIKALQKEIEQLKGFLHYILKNYDNILTEHEKIKIYKTKIEKYGLSLHTVYSNIIQCFTKLKTDFFTGRFKIKKGFLKQIFTK